MGTQKRWLGAGIGLWDIELSADSNERLCAVAVGSFFTLCSTEAAYLIRPDSWFPIDT